VSVWGTEREEQADRCLRLFVYRSIDGALSCSTGASQRRSFLGGGASHGWWPARTAAFASGSASHPALHLLRQQTLLDLYMYLLLSFLVWCAPFSVQFLPYPLNELEACACGKAKCEQLQVYAAKNLEISQTGRRKDWKECFRREDRRAIGRLTPECRTGTWCLEAGASKQGVSKRKANCLQDRGGWNVPAWMLRLLEVLCTKKRKREP
jgi:hypothetical protein